jgi:site-specific recombinase XerD
MTTATQSQWLCSTLFRQGIEINVVSKLLGHKDVATNYKIYIHMIPEEKDEAVDAVGKVIRLSTGV